jgi:CrcB protein
MSTALELLPIAVGGALGAILRAAFHRAVARVGRGHRLPIGPALATLTANGLGCLALSAWLHAAPFTGGDAFSWADPLVTIGFCGGLTTFSTLCGDAVRLDRADRRAAAVYLAATLAVGLGGWSLGSAIGV